MLIFIAGLCVNYLQGKGDSKFAAVVLNSTLYFTLALPLCMHSYTFIRVIYFNVYPVIMSLSIAMQQELARKKFMLYALFLALIWEFTSTYGGVRELVLDSNIINIL